MGKDEKRSDDLHERKSIASAESSESENRHISPAPKSQSVANVINKSAKKKADKSELDLKFDERICSIESSTSQKKEKCPNNKNQLFFCYSCKSIFISSAALELHKENMGHFE